MKKKKTNVAVLLFVLIIGIGGIVSIVAYSMHVNANIPQLYVRERRGTGERLYRNTVGINIRENYPRNPAQLMDLYLLSVSFLYGNIILDEGIFMEVIEFQREMFSDELLASSTAQSQFDNLMASLEVLDYLGLSLRTSTVENIRHDFYDQRTALAYVIHPFFLQDNIYRVYHLAMDENNKWRINSWSQADSDFNILP